MSLTAALDENARAVEIELARLLSSAGPPQSRLDQAMCYAALGGGKRLRAFLVMESGRVLAAPLDACRRIAASLEMMHAYSLIHDDLPAMDDARLRRGKTTCHLAFDEATAILAGDALQALAFDVIAQDDSPIAKEARAPVCAELARSAGACGMCGGQMLDLIGERTVQDLDAVLRMQRLKTGALFEYACTIACHLSEQGPRSRSALCDFAQAFGLGFQIRDDMLDLSGDPCSVGKDLGRDAQAGKSTIISLLGAKAAEAKLLELGDKAEAALERISGDTSLLRELMNHSLTRQS